MKRFYRILCCIAFTLFVVFSFIDSASEESIQTDIRSQVLEALRNEPLTIGQALDVVDTIASESKATRVPVSLILAVIRVESEFKFYATSHKNRKGLMQLSPVVWKIYAGDTEFKNHSNAYEPALNVRVGIRYLSDLYKQYGSWEKTTSFNRSGTGLAPVQGVSETDYRKGLRFSHRLGKGS